MSEHVCNMVIEEGGVVLDFEDGLYPARCTICGLQDYIARHVCHFVPDTSTLLMSLPPMYKAACSCGKTAFLLHNAPLVVQKLATAKL